MGKVYIRSLQTGDIGYVAEHMRVADRQEVIASRGDILMRDALAESVLMSTACWALVAPDHEPLAIFGVAAVNMLEGVGAPWMLGTERVAVYGGALVRFGREYSQRMLRDYPHLVNYVDARNDKSIRWLRRIGYQICEERPIGPYAMPFHRFEMRA